MLPNGHIEVRPHGPYVRASRVSVSLIAALSNAGHDAAYIHEAFPTLTSTQVQAALHYYRANAAEIDAIPSAPPVPQTPLRPALADRLRAARARRNP